MSETARILAMPCADAGGYALLARSLPLIRPGSSAQLREAQAHALGTLAVHGGVVCQLGCGDGKGLVSMLGAAVVGARRPLVLVPARLQATFRAEFTKFDRLGFNLPRNIELRSHDYVSRHSRFLDEYLPDYLFVDEAEAYRDPMSARTERLMRFLNATPTRARGGSLTFGVASGTLISDSILDCAHLETHALGPLSSTPRSPTPRRGPTLELESWSHCLDTDGRPGPSDWRATLDLTAWHSRGAAHCQHTVRAAYAARRRCAPGTVISDAESVGVPLAITLHTEPRPPANVQAAIDLVESGIDPVTGDPLLGDDNWKALRQLSIGCYYRWNWANVGRETPDALWLIVRSQYMRAIARELRLRCAPDYDSEGCVETAIANDTAHPLRSVWAEWQDVKKCYDIAALREIVVINNWLARHIVERALRGPPAIIWYASAGAEMSLIAQGIPCYGAGTTTPAEPEFCGLSMRVHGRGVNLQDRWSTAYFLEFPKSGQMAEQVIARLHRPGQASPVKCHVWTHTKAFSQAFRRARERAEFLGFAQGRQRLQYADISEDI